MSRVRGTLLAAATLGLVLTAGCGGLSNGPLDRAAGGTSASVTTVPGTETATDPRTEDRATSTSTRAQNQQVAVKVPRLPIGGQEDDEGNDEQCVPISYLGANHNPIPPGVSIAVTGISLTPSLLEPGGSACSSDKPPCVGFSFTAENTDSGTCNVAVHATGERPAGDDDDDFTSPIRDVTLTLAGLVHCPDGEEALCADFAGRVAKDDQSIDLEVRIVGTTTETAGGTTGSTSTPTQESSSSGVTSSPPD